MKEETKKWIDKAKQDLEVSKSMFKVKRYEYAAFWCQQSAEKSFKAIQIERENKFDKIHDLVILAKKVGAPEKLAESCKKLTVAYTYARYPDADTGKENMKEISQNFIKNAEEIFEWTKTKI